MDLRDSIYSELNKIRAENEQHGFPQNEKDTERLVILPLLKAAGYSDREIHSRGDDAGRFPDFTILPHSEHVWFLEAKKWADRLTSSGVQQAIEYAHSAGKRWVVLTNGREWQLYDDHINATNAGRKVVSVVIDDPESLTAFLIAISRESVQSGRLLDYSDKKRSTQVLCNELLNSEGELHGIVVRTLRQKHGIDLKRQDLLAIISDAINAHLANKGTEIVDAPNMSTKSALDSQHELEAVPSILFSELPLFSITGSKPLGVIFSNGENRKTSTWADVAVVLMSYAFHRKDLEDNYRSGSKSKVPFVSSSSEGMRSPKRLQLQDREIYIDTHDSARGLMEKVRNFLEKSSISTSDMSVKLSE